MTTENNEYLKKMNKIKSHSFVLIILVMLRSYLFIYLEIFFFLKCLSISNKLGKKQ